MTKTPRAIPHPPDLRMASAMGTTAQGALRFHTVADDRGATIIAGGCNGVGRTVEVIQHRRSAVYYALSGDVQSLFAPDAAAYRARIASPIHVSRC